MEYLDRVGLTTTLANLPATAVRAAQSLLPNPRPRDSYPGGRGDNAMMIVTAPGTTQSITLDWFAESGAWGTTEDLAMQIPAFCQGTTLISSSCGAFPWWSHKGDYVPLPVPVLLNQPDPEVPGNVTWTRIYRDMVLYPFAWAYVLSRYADGFPARMRHVPYGQCHVGSDYITVDGAEVDPRDVIRFDSPTAPGALWNGRRILATSILIEEAVRRYANFDIPAGHLKQTSGPDLLDDEIIELLTDWEKARRQHATGYLSQGLEWKEGSFDPSKLQLITAREENARDIARLLNLPPSSVNAETGSSLTYSTVSQQQQALLNTSMVPYLDAVRNRLSMPDVTPRGTYVLPAYREFLRADLTQQAQALIAAVGAGIMTVDEARQAMHLPEMAPGGTQ